MRDREHINHHPQPLARWYAQSHGLHQRHSATATRAVAHNHMASGRNIDAKHRPHCHRVAVRSVDVVTKRPTDTQCRFSHRHTECVHNRTGTVEHRCMHSCVHRGHSSGSIVTRRTRTGALLVTPRVGCPRRGPVREPEARGTLYGRYRRPVRRPSPDRRVREGYSNSPASPERPPGRARGPDRTCLRATRRRSTPAHKPGGCPEGDRRAACN